MKKSTNKELLERRTKMLRDKGRGVSLKVLVESLSKKYGIAEKTIYNDWAKRSEWAPQISQRSDPNMLDEQFAGLKQILAAAWALSISADNDSAKVGALRLAQDTHLKIIDLQQSLGIVEKKPIEMQQKIIVEMWDPEKEQKDQEKKAE